MNVSVDTRTMILMFPLLELLCRYVGWMTKRLAYFGAHLFVVSLLAAGIFKICLLSCGSCYKELRVLYNTTNADVATGFLPG